MAPKKKQTAAASTEAPTETTSTDLRGRLFLPLQSAGRMGKSTLVDFYVGWLDHADIPWRGADMDSVHKTFSRAYSDNVRLMPLESPETIPQMLHQLTSTEPVPVSVCDMPAQATTRVLDAFRDFGAVELLAGAGIRITVPLFLVDDTGARESLAAVVSRLRDSVDYVLVRNPAVKTSSRIEAVPAVAALIEDGTPIITLPHLSAVTLDCIAALQKQEQRFFSLSSVAPLLPGMPRMELTKACARVWRQMEQEAADVLLPDRSLIRNKVQGGHAQEEAAEVNPFDA